MPNFRFFQDGGRPPSWICYVCVRTTHEGYLVVFIAVQNLIFLTVGRLRRGELRRHAKFGRNRSNCGRDMAILEFFKMAAAAILNFSNFKFSTVGRLKRAELRRRAKCGHNRSKRGRDMAICRLFNMAAAAVLDF